MRPSWGRVRHFSLTPPEIFASPAYLLDRPASMTGYARRMAWRRLPEPPPRRPSARLPSEANSPAKRGRYRLIGRRTELVVFAKFGRTSAWPPNHPTRPHRRSAPSTVRRDTRMLPLRPTRQTPARNRQIEFIHGTPTNRGVVGCFKVTFPRSSVQIFPGQGAASPCLVQSSTFR